MRAAERFAGISQSPQFVANREGVEKQKTERQMQI